MSRSDRRHSRNRNWNNRENTNERVERTEKHEGAEKKTHHEKRGSGSYERRQERRRFAASAANQKELEESRNAIRAFKENVVTCELCGKPIEEISSAISNKGSGNPVHFDCVLNKLSESEKIASTERLAYIGQGRFAVLYFENPHDQKHFTIRKTIEWEGRDVQRGAWRDEMAGLYSQVK
ncbi:MAG: hypothetical protein IJ158_03905 [Treponema sp.]|nr:hypothetical protein [Treponema sp.]